MIILLRIQFGAIIPHKGTTTTWKTWDHLTPKFVHIFLCMCNMIVLSYLQSYWLPISEVLFLLSDGLNLVCQLHLLNLDNYTTFFQDMMSVCCPTIINVNGFIVFNTLLLFLTIVVSTMYFVLYQ